MQKSTILYLAAGAAALYVLTRKASHPVEQAADALTKAADASVKASDAAVTTAIAADKLASAAAGVTTKGMGRRSAAKGAELTAARVLGIKNAMLANALAEEKGQRAHGLSKGTQAFLEGLKIGGKRVRYAPDEPSTIYFHNRAKKGLEAELEVPFSVYVGKEGDNTLENQTKFLGYLNNQAAGAVGGRDMTNERNSWSRAHYYENPEGREWDWTGTGYSNSKTEPKRNQKPGPQLRKPEVNAYEQGRAKPTKSARPKNLAD